jgi:peptidoglycan/LPS O-acetylase OafA/YrhL
VCGSGKLGIHGAYLGVQAFFVLSGFLLTPILVNMKSNLDRKDFFIHFYGRRALRIFPLYYSYIAIVASVYILAKFSQYGHLISTIDRTILVELNKFIYSLPWTTTYTYDFYHAGDHYHGSSFDTHFWSLAVEEQFYLVWPLAIFFIRHDSLKKFLWLIIALGPLMRILLTLAINANVLPLHKETNTIIYLLPFSYIDAFAIGGYFSLYGKSKPSNLVWMYILTVFMLGLATTWLATRQIRLDDLGYAPYMKDSYKYVWGYSAMSLLFSIVLVNIRDKAFLPALFENPILIYLGTISYGMYVFHLPVLAIVYAEMKNLPEIARAATTLLITIMISTVSYELMEKRFINLKDKYFIRASAAK